MQVEYPNKLLATQGIFTPQQAVHVLSYLRSLVEHQVTPIETLHPREAQVWKDWIDNEKVIMVFL